jgi:hypothetical protein
LFLGWATASVIFSGRTRIALLKTESTKAWSLAYPVARARSTISLIFGGDRGLRSADVATGKHNHLAVTTWSGRAPVTRDIYATHNNTENVN